MSASSGRKRLGKPNRKPLDLEGLDWLIAWATPPRSRTPRPVRDQGHRRRDVATVDAFFGTPAWRAIAPYPVSREFGSPPRYWIVHASDFLDAAMLMNNEMVKVDRELFLRTFETEGTLEGIVEAEYNSRMAEALAALQTDVLAAITFAGAGGIAFADLRASLLDDYFGRVKDGAYANTLKQLVPRRAREATEGALEREARRARSPSPSVGLVCQFQREGGRLWRRRSST